MGMADFGRKGMCCHSMRLYPLLKAFGARLRGPDESLTMPFPPDVPRLQDMPQSRLPLRGVTVLVVEDSRFACDALRLILTRAGAGLRRAETLAAGRRQLGRCRPDLAIVDIGLPDGKGDILIGEIAALGLPVLAISGDPDARMTALQAGAVAFLDKPLPSVQRLVRLVAQLVTGAGVDAADAAGALPPARKADPLALRDDLARAVALVGDNGGTDAAYATGFVRSLARDAGDTVLEAAALGAKSAAGHAALAQLLRQRLEGTASVT